MRILTLSDKIRIFNLLLIFALVIPATAQKKAEAESEWDVFRFTEYDSEVAAGLREVQQLMQGRESLLQSYERTDQSMIATERAIEQLYQERINTQKAALAYYETSVNFKFPDSDFPDEFPGDDLTDDTTEEDAPVQMSIEEEPEPPIPPLFKIRSLSETSDGISVEIDNLGDAIDALVSVTDSGGTVISNPYHIEFSDWDYPRYISFRLLNRSDKINLLIQSADGKSYRIPLFIRQQIRKPQISAFPLEQRAKIGESVEYSIVIEGDGSDRGRYPIRVAKLPNGIAWQMAKVIPAQIADEQPRTIPIRNVMFSQAFNRHEFTFQLTLSRDLPKRFIGKPLEFELRIGKIPETLTITPIGVGELTIDVPAVVQMRLGESREVPINLANIGTSTVEAISVRSAGTVYGVTVNVGDTIALAASERRELPVTVTVAKDASIGLHEIRLVVSSSAGSQTAPMHLEIMPKAFALLSGMTTPALVIVGIMVAILGGIKAQQFRQRREQEKVMDYELGLEADFDGGDN